MSTYEDGDPGEQQKRDAKLASEMAESDFKAAQDSFLAKTTDLVHRSQDQPALSIGAAEPMPRASPIIGRMQAGEEENLQFNATGKAPDSDPQAKKTTGIGKTPSKIKEKGEISWKQLMIEIEKLLTMIFKEFPKVFKDWARERNKRIEELGRVATGGKEGLAAAKDMLNDLELEMNNDPHIGEDVVLQSQLNVTRQSLSAAQNALTVEAVENLEDDFAKARQVAADVSAGVAEAPVITAAKLQKPNAPETEAELTAAIPIAPKQEKLEPSKPTR